VASGFLVASPPPNPLPSFMDTRATRAGRVDVAGAAALTLSPVKAETAAKATMLGSGAEE
jgi:hypothetical protein